MAEAQIQTTASEQQVRTAIETALQAQGGATVENRPGLLSMDVGGSVRSAYLAGGFRNKMKMPMRIVVTTAEGAGGTGVTLDVHSRGTAGGAMSGGWLGAVKQGKAENAWLAMAVDAVPDKVGAPAVPPAPPA
ncbi:MAG: hypothetical protein ACRDKA_06605 [Actinomycetota bacterium]